LHISFALLYSLLQKRLLTCTLLKLCLTQVLFNKCRMQVKCVMFIILIKCCKYFVLCLLYINDTTPWQAICISTTLKYNRSLEKHVLAYFQQTCSQIYFRFSSYLLRKRSTAFICNIDRDWMIYRKHPIRSLLTSMLRKANIRYPSDVYALSFEKYEGK
jgi:hypothetical protein